jgi:hypothetical protein
VSFRDIIFFHIETEELVDPCSDIAGANAAGWSSILVKTGVYDASQGPPAHEPTYFAEDVEEGVMWAIDREYARTGEPR